MIKDLLEQKITKEGVNQTSIEEVILVKLTAPVAKTSAVLPPGLCLVGQGEKYIYVGEQQYVYNKDRCLLGSVKLPIYAELKKATLSTPYLGMAILLNASVISQLLIEYDQFDKEIDTRVDGLITTIDASEELYELVAQLLGILGNPMDEKILGAQYLREIYYFLLKSAAGTYMRNCALQHARAHKLAPVLHYLENNLLEDITIEDLVNRFGMSESSLHDNFKKTTTLPPMQYVKRLKH